MQMDCEDFTEWMQSKNKCFPNKPVHLLCQCIPPYHSIHGETQSEFHQFQLRQLLSEIPLYWTSSRHWLQLVWYYSIQLWFIKNNSSLTMI